MKKEAFLANEDELKEIKMKLNKLSYMHISWKLPSLESYQKELLLIMAPGKKMFRLWKV